MFIRTRSKIFSSLSLSLSLSKTNELGLPWSSREAVVKAEKVYRESAAARFLLIREFSATSLERPDSPAPKDVQPNVIRHTKIFAKRIFTPKVRS